MAATTINGIDIEVQVPAAIGIVVARRVTIEPAPPDLQAEIADAISAFSPDDDTKKQVRDLLRFGKYKPTGRGKPACEYLQKAAAEDRFPAINNLVDVLNLVSLRQRLPISLIDTDLAKATRFVVRRGVPDESYVFNAGGQTIGLQDLLLTASVSEPSRPEGEACANPVKDSMRTKLVDGSTNVLAVVYAPPALIEIAKAATDSLAVHFSKYGRPESCAHGVVSSPV